MIIARDGLGDLVFQFLDQDIEPLFQVGVDVLEPCGGAAFLMRAELGQQPFAYLGQLCLFL